MDLSPLTLAKLLIPRLPMIFKIAIMNRLGYSPCSDKQDPRTEIIVAIIRSSLKVSKPLGVIQAGSLKDPGVKGPMWIATAVCPAPETDVREAVVRGIKEIGDGDEKFDLPDVVDVEGEWTGYRSGVGKNEPRLQLPGGEREQYQKMMGEVKSDLTVLYFHGGAYIVMDPISHRQLTSGLARRTGGRCFSVRYRLAPQTPFPGQLLDALVAYLYLLSPPEGAFYEPVKASDIVFAGDSAGGHLSFSLLLLILALRKAGVMSIRFHGKDVPLEVPAGVSGNSPWFDIMRCLPSTTDNAKYDYLAAPTATGLPARPLPDDDLWPARPPRAEMFCRSSTLRHPLCSPLYATKEMWQGAPPVFSCCGNEGLEDEIVVVTRRIYQSGAAVEFFGYEGQPHCFGMIFPTTPHGGDELARWADFMKRAIEGKVERTDEGKWWKAKTNPMQWQPVKLGEMGVSDDIVEKRTKEMHYHAGEREVNWVRDYEKKGQAKL